ncbi:MAG: hypothetical protein Q7R70_00775 [Candidatus Diapherotrites archaeon]|nr:hypothetical protein [Candidatus Diapherotrites archaeon]
MGKPSRRQSRIQRNQAKQAKPGIVRPGFFARNKKKAIVFGTATALALGGFAGVKGVNALRFAKWKQNQSLTVMLGSHQHSTDVIPLANALEKARQSGRPFDFLVLENSAIRAGERKEKERVYNKHCAQVRQMFARELEQGNIAPITEFLRQKGAFKGSPEQVSHGNALIAYAAKYGLRIKLGEEYSRREFERAEALSGKQMQLLGESKENLPTSAVLEKARQVIIAEKNYLRLRNQALANITSRAAAELRKENPVLRSRELKGAVQAGLGHFGVVEEIKRKGIKGMKVDVIVDLSKERFKRIPAGTKGVFSIPATDLLAESRAKGQNATPEQVALTFLIEPIYRGAVNAGDSKQAVWIAQQAFRQTPQNASMILSQVQGLTGQPRVIKIMELMTGQKTVIQ